MITCAETDCPFKTFGGWCGLTACIRRNTTTVIGANPVWVIPDDYVKEERCRDCKYYAINRLTKAYEPDKRFNPSVCIIGEFARLRKPDWFCADGERRESECQG